MQKFPDVCAVDCVHGLLGNQACQLAMGKGKDDSNQISGKPG
jgi:hypothetical protein